MLVPLYHWPAVAAEHSCCGRADLPNDGKFHSACDSRYDDLRNYNNERSLYLAQLRNSIEEPWQQWELGHFDIEAYKSKSLDEVQCHLIRLL